MSGDTAPGPESGQARDSLRGLLRQLAGRSAAVLRDELELSTQEVQGRVQGALGGLVTVGIGVLVVQAAVLALGAAAVIGLAPRWGWGMAALLVGTGLAVIGGVVGFIGWQQLHRMELTPRTTLQRLKGGQAWSNESA